MVLPTQMRVFPLFPTCSSASGFKMSAVDAINSCADDTAEKFCYCFCMSHILILSDFPLPPSINQGYRNVPGVGRVSAEPLKKFKKEVESWKLVHGRNISDSFRVLMETKWRGVMAFHVSYGFVFKRERLYTKKGLPKRLDADSRIKFAQDAVFGCLGIDDKFCFSGEFIKVVGERECCVVTIQPAEPMSAVELFQSFNNPSPTTESEQ